MRNKGYKKEIDELDISILLKNIKKKYNLSAEDIIDLFKKERKEKQDIALPLSIFNSKLGMLESASLYLKDKKNMSFNEISQLLGRNYKTIWTSYNKAKKKIGKVNKKKKRRERNRR